MLFCLHEFLRKSRRNFIFRALIAFILGLNALSQGQAILKIYGQVLSAAGPVSGISVRLDKTPYSTITDLGGFYRFYDISDGIYLLYCEQDNRRFDLAEKLIVGDGPTIRRDIYLDSGTINIAPVVVEADREERELDKSRIVVELAETPVNIGDIITKIPGLNVISAGDGEFFIASNGGRSEALEVYVDGRKINSILTGKADLNQIPLGTLARVEYYPAGGLIGDKGGLTGRIDFISGSPARQEVLSIGTYTGTYGRNDFDIQYNHSRTGFGNLELGWEQTKKKNDYRYTDYYGNPQTRMNADLRSDKAYLSYANSINGYLIKFSGYADDRSSGIPGKTITPSLNARTDKLAISAGGEIGYFVNEVGKFSFDFSYQNRRARYRDLVGATPYLTQYDELENSLGFSISGKEFGYIKPVVSISITRERLEGKDNLRPEFALGIVHRDIFNLGSGIRFHNKISSLNIESGISGNLENVKRDNYLSYNAQSSLWLDYRLRLGLNLTAGESYRLPGLAELNWKEDVFVIANPDLRPERSDQMSIGLFGEFQAVGEWRLSVEYRDIRYQDLIYWRRSQGLRYKPVNISRSDYFGTAIAVAYNSPGNIAAIDISRVKAISLNRERGQPYYGKRVIFQPSYVNRFQIGINYAGWSGRFEIQDVSERYYLEENTKALDPYALLNCGLNYQVRAFHAKTELQIKIDNLTDERYELLEYQPMPPRTFGAGLTINF